MIKNVDNLLVDALLKGDDRAFSRFFKSYFPRLFQFSCVRLWNDQNLAEEAAQAALTKAVQNLDSFRGEATLFTWMCTFCRHEIGYIIKRENKLGERIPLDDDNDNENIIAALASMSHMINQGDPFVHYQKHELASLVHTAKTHIPTLYSDVLEWKYLNEYSVKEIATRLGRSPKAVESTLTRARTAFKESFLVIINTETEGA